MKSKILLVLMTTAVLFVFSSCSKNDEVLILPTGNENASIAAQNVEAAVSTIDPIFSECNDIDEIAAHLDAIRQIESVEDAWTDEQTMFVKIKNAGTIFFLYPQAETMADTIVVAQSRKAPSKTTSIQPRTYTTAHTAVIINQQSKDEDRSWKYEKIADPLLTKFVKSGITATYKDAGKASVSFFGDEFFNYDLIFLITHGCYDEKTKLHWIATGEEVTVMDEEQSDDTKAQKHFDEMYLNNTDNNQVTVGCIKEKRGGKMLNVYYKVISEEFIKAQDKRFSNNSKAIIYTSACYAQAKQASLGEAIMQKGAACFAGWTSGNHIGDQAGLDFFCNLLSGCTINNAEELLPQNEKKELYKNTYPTELVLWVSYREQTGSLCLFQPSTESPIDYSNLEEMSYLLTGRFDACDKESNKYGFCIGTDPEMKKFDILEGMRPFNDTEISSCTFYEDNNYFVDFSLFLRNNYLELGKTYYVSSYVYDGCDYNLSTPVKFVAGTKGELGLFELKGPVKSLTNDIGYYTFDENGFWKTVNGQSPASTYGWEKIERDGLGRMIKCCFDSYGETYEEYRYNGAGRKVYYNYSFYDAVTNEEYHYDEYGDVSNVNGTDYDMEVESYTLTYIITDKDHYDNWTSREVYKNGNKTGVETRTITYYQE